MAEYQRLSLTIPVGTPLCPFGIAYRRIYDCPLLDYSRDPFQARWGVGEIIPK